MPRAPDLQPAIRATAEYQERKNGILSLQQIETLAEIRCRLGRLEFQAVELIDLNNRMLEKRGSHMRFDPVSESLIFLAEGAPEMRLKFDRGNPDVPVKIGATTIALAYHAGNSDGLNESELLLRIELEEKLESYYQSAHRVLKLFRLLPMPSRIKCDSVTRIRNDLIEHPGTGALYSFGAGDTGPRVKPIYREPQKFNDNGLVPNTMEFIAAIVKGCA